MRRWQVRARAVTPERPQPGGNGLVRRDDGQAVTLGVPSQVETAWSGATMATAAALACEGKLRAERRRVRRPGGSRRRLGGRVARVTLGHMAILVDPPLWPKHGRVWGHMVSDTSLAELHAIAREAGIPARGFDRDHYDVPEEMIEKLVALGVQRVTTRELIVRLRASGLRVTSAERNGRH